MAGGLMTSVDVDATPEVVWEVLTDVPAHPRWAAVLTGTEGAFADGEADRAAAGGPHRLRARLSRGRART
jgi:uncharacterized protein YndB with AHSA1/START domain